MLAYRSRVQRCSDVGYDDGAGGGHLALVDVDRPVDPGIRAAHRPKIDVGIVHRIESEMAEDAVTAKRVGLISALLRSDHVTRRRPID